MVTAGRPARAALGVPGGVANLGSIVHFGPPRRGGLTFGNIVSPDPPPQNRAMTQTKWGEALSLSVPEMDQDHKELIALVSAFSRAVEADASRGETEARLTQLIRGFRCHCESEEELMRSSGFPELELHAEEHRKLIAQMTGLRDDVGAGIVRVCTALGEFVWLWTEQHIAGPDARFAGFLRARPARSANRLSASGQ